MIGDGGAVSVFGSSFSISKGGTGKGAFNDAYICFRLLGCRLTSFGFAPNGKLLNVDIFVVLNERGEVMQIPIPLFSSTLDWGWEWGWSVADWFGDSIWSSDQVTFDVIYVLVIVTAHLVMCHCLISSMRNMVGNINRKTVTNYTDSDLEKTLDAIRSNQLKPSYRRRNVINCGPPIQRWWIWFFRWFRETFHCCESFDKARDRIAVWHRKRNDDGIDMYQCQWKVSNCHRSSHFWLVVGWYHRT